MVELQPADYVLGAFAVLMAVLGIFRGLSGTLAFVAGVASATVVGGVAWRFAPDFFEAVWAQGAITLVVALVAFGIVRALVRATVHRLLAQPADAIFGLVSGAIVGVAPVVAWALVGRGLEYSALALEVSSHVG